MSQQVAPASAYAQQAAPAPAATYAQQAPAFAQQAAPAPVLIQQAAPNIGFAPQGAPAATAFSDVTTHSLHYQPAVYSQGPHVTPSYSSY